jgi:hypothetical protein
MRKMYRDYILGTISFELKERIAFIQASAILDQRKDNTPGYTKDLNSKNGKRK